MVFHKTLAEEPGVARGIKKIQKKNRFCKKKLKAYVTRPQAPGNPGSLKKYQPIWSSGLANYS